MLQKKVADIISRLKRVREENGLSYQRIVELVEQNGEYVSLSTVKRVFEPGSEAYGFQYENTLRPIANAVLGLYDDSGEASADEAGAMKAIIDYKTEKITELTARIERMETSYRRRLEFLTKQIDLKDSRIDRRDAMIEKLLDAMLLGKGCDSCVCPSRTEARADFDVPAEKQDGRPGADGAGDAGPA